jgi:hypothetical protein
MDEKAHQDRKIVKDIQQYTDDELWAVVDQRLTQKQDTRLRRLIALGKQGQLSVDEQAEMERLVHLVDHHMLLRSEALLLLQQRGHDIDTYLNPKQN